MNTNINSKFLQEAVEIEHKWKNDPKLKELMKKVWAKDHTAVMLESQRLVNEVESKEEIKGN